MLTKIRIGLFLCFKNKNADFENVAKYFLATSLMWLIVFLRIIIHPTKSNWYCHKMSHSAILSLTVSRSILSVMMELLFKKCWVLIEKQKVVYQIQWLYVEMHCHYDTFKGNEFWYFILTYFFKSSWAIISFSGNKNTWNGSTLLSRFGLMIFITIKA